jgi:hypothetical protein
MMGCYLSRYVCGLGLWDLLLCWVAAKNLIKFINHCSDSKNMLVVGKFLFGYVGGLSKYVMSNRGKITKFS